MSLKRCKPFGLAKWFEDQWRVKGFSFRHWFLAAGFDFFFGVQSNIPVCCIIEFILRRGPTPCVEWRSCTDEWAHCWFHRQLRHDPVKEIATA